MIEIAVKVMFLSFAGMFITLFVWGVFLLYVEITKYRKKHD